MGNPIDRSTQTERQSISDDTEIYIKLYYTRYKLRELENKLSNLERIPTRLNTSYILNLIDRTRDDILLSFNDQ